MKEKLYVEIGGGEAPRKGFEQLDSLGGFNLITDEIPYEDNSIDMIYMSHIIEHIPLYSVPKVLNSINKKLKPGGLARILCPDLEKIIEAYVNKDFAAFNSGKNHWSTIHPLNSKLGIGGYLMNQILSTPVYATTADIDLYAADQKIVSYAHISAYDYEMLQGLLKLSGFKRVMRTPLTRIDTHQQEGQLIVNAWK